MSVILLSYNQGHYLRSAVESVLGQTFQDFELLIVDNGSTDESPEILNEYRADQRVRLMLFPDHGNPSLRCNQAVAESRGEFVSFLYSDDYYLPNKLECQISHFATLPDNYGVVYAPPMRINVETGKTWVEPPLARSGDVFEDFMLRSAQGSIDMISPMTRRTCFIERPFDENVFAEAEGIFLRISLGHRFSYISEPLTVAREHGVNAGKALIRNLQITQGTLALLRRDPAIRESQRPLVDYYEAWLLRRYGWIGVRICPDMRWARRCFFQSVRMAPRNALHVKTIAGIFLSYLPSGFRAKINGLGHWLRRSAAQTTYVEDYEGLLREAEPSRS